MSSQQDASSRQDTASEISDSEHLAQALELKDLIATTNVHPIEGSMILVSVKGPQSRIDDIEATVTGEKLVITDTALPGSHDGSISIINGNLHVSSMVSMNTVINGRNAVISQSSRSLDAVTINIGIPRGTPVTLSGMSGRVSLGDIESPIDGSISGIGSIKAGKLGSIDLAISGTASFEADSVIGDVSASLSGTGGFTVHKGAIDSLNVSASGTASAYIRCTAATARLSASGVSNVYVAEVRGKVNSRQGGLGTVSIGKG